jgi:hypothetical protein
MIRVQNIEEAKKYLEDGVTLMYKFAGEDINYIAYNDKKKLMNFNEQLRYPLDYDDIGKIMEETSIFVYLPSDENDN